MGQPGMGVGEGFDAAVDAVDGPVNADQGPYSPVLHRQLKAIADESAAAIALVEEQITHLQESIERRHADAQAAADELRAYEQRHSDKVAPGGTDTEGGR